MATISSDYSATTTLTITLSSSWLKDPANPTLNVPVTVRNLEPVIAAQEHSVFYPLNMVDPVVVSGVRRSEQGSITLLVTTQAELDSLATLLSPSRTLLFQKPQEGSTSPITSTYIRVVGEIAVSRLAQPADRPHREVTLPYVEVATP